MAQARTAVLDPSQHQPGSVAIGNIGGLYQRPEHQALGIHQQMALMPIYSLGPVIALETAYDGGFDRLALENGCPRLRIPPGLDPDGRMQRLVERIPADLQPPEAKVVVHGFPRWQIMGRQ